MSRGVVDAGRESTKAPSHSRSAGGHTSPDQLQGMRQLRLFVYLFSPRFHSLATALWTSSLIKVQGTFHTDSTLIHIHWLHSYDE